MKSEGNEIIWNTSNDEEEHKDNNENSESEYFNTFVAKRPKGGAFNSKKRLPDLFTPANSTSMHLPDDIKVTMVTQMKDIP